MNQKPKQLDCEVLKTVRLTKDYFELTFSWPSKAPAPGEFFTVGSLDQQSPLLRRPFAFSSYNPDKKSASAIIQLRGEGTKLILQKKEGDFLNILAPLGRGFNTENISSRPICIGGGIGLGPILFLYKELKKQGKNPLLVSGFRSLSLIPINLLHGERSDQILCTDDGSKGFSGNVVDYLKSIIPSELSKADLFCCGPHPMLAAVAQFAKEYELPCTVSVEEIMACGVGACMGCSVPKADGKSFFRACKEGPTFDSREILWT